MAFGGVVELGEAEAVPGQGVQVRRFDFRAVAAEVGETEIVDHEEDEIWGFCRPSGKAHYQ